MALDSPIVVGGSGHSGTRIFAQILDYGGVFVGIRKWTRHPATYDLNIIDLFDRWQGPFLRGELTPSSRALMESEFRRRLWYCLPFRFGRWGWKNPRTLVFLPFLADMFSGLRFIHVIRDGRDMAFGNKMIRPDHPQLPLFLQASERHLPLHQQWILYWGRENLRAQEIGESRLKNRYLIVRFEDLCVQPRQSIGRIADFCQLRAKKIDGAESLVKSPPSIGRWRSHDPRAVEEAIAVGRPYLQAFGYLH